MKAIAIRVARTFAPPIAQVVIVVRCISVAKPAAPKI
jgi:hypothetical protein